MPAFIARQHIPGLDIVVDPCAAILVFIVTGLLCFGIKEVYYASCSSSFLSFYVFLMIQTRFPLIYKVFYLVSLVCALKFCRVHGRKSLSLQQMYVP